MLEYEKYKGYNIYGNDIDVAQRKAADFNRAYLRRQFECGNA